MSEAFKPFFEQGFDIRPTIAVTRAHFETRTGAISATGAMLACKREPAPKLKLDA